MPKGTSIDVYFYSPNDPVKMELKETKMFIGDIKRPDVQLFPPNGKDYKIGCRFSPSESKKFNTIQGIYKFLTSEDKEDISLMKARCRVMEFDPKSLKYTARSAKNSISSILKKDSDKSMWIRHTSDAIEALNDLQKSLTINQDPKIPIFSVNDTICRYEKGKRVCYINDGTKLNKLPNALSRKNVMPKSPIYYKTYFEISSRMDEEAISLGEELFQSGFEFGDLGDIELEDIKS